MNHLGPFEPGTRDAQSQSPAILVVAGARRFRASPSLFAERTAYRRTIGLQVRKSASPQVRPRISDLRSRKLHPPLRTSPPRPHRQQANSQHQQRHAAAAATATRTSTFIDSRYTVTAKAVAIIAAFKSFRAKLAVGNRARVGTGPCFAKKFGAFGIGAATGAERAGHYVVVVTNVAERGDGFARHGVRAARGARLRAKTYAWIFGPIHAFAGHALAIGTTQLAELRGRTINVGRWAIRGAGAIAAARSTIRIVGAADFGAFAVGTAAWVVLIDPWLQE